MKTQRDKSVEEIYEILKEKERERERERERDTKMVDHGHTETAAYAIRRGNIRCYECDKLGHIAKKCWHRGKDTWKEHRNKNEGQRQEKIGK